MDELSSVTGVVALAAAAIALIALGWSAVLTRRLRRVRADQRVVLGDASAAQDLVAHAAGLDRGYQALHDYVQDAAGRLDERVGETERRLGHAVAHRGLVRYDAYNEMSGRQSTSVALLDPLGSGIVLTSIHHRDQARLYAKQVVNGQGELELSPEEQEAVRMAMAGELPGDVDPNG